MEGVTNLNVLHARNVFLAAVCLLTGRSIVREMVLVI